MDNPYNHLPDDAYMQSLIHSVTGGKPLIADPLPWPADGRPLQSPSGLAVIKSDYSSVTLSWSNAGTAPLAFAVLWAGEEVARLPGTMTKVTIGNIPPGLPSLTFSVCAIGGDGTQSAPSNTVSASTLPLKDNRAVINVKVTGSASATTSQILTRPVRSRLGQQTTTQVTTFALTIWSKAIHYISILALC
jgi:hypothetical protein